jgi:hypothetical protein
VDGLAALSWRIFNVTDGGVKLPDDYISYYYAKNLMTNHGSRSNSYVEEEELIATICIQGVS